MYNNKVAYISEQQAKDLITTLKQDKGYHIGVIDGIFSKTWLEYLEQIRLQYKFPTKEDVFEGYLDWMEDLSWLNKNAFALFIFNYNDFLSKEPQNKKIVMEMFTEILNWWSTDADKYWNEGMTRPFNVYLVK